MQAPFVAILERDKVILIRHFQSMLSEWLQMALVAANLSQADLARHLTERLNRSIDRAAVNKMIKGRRAIAADELIEIERITGFISPSNITVALVGRVGAGQYVEAINLSDSERVEAPPHSKPETVAVEVSGDSMFPRYDNGTVLYYTQKLPAVDLINTCAIVQLADGRAYVKIIRPGSQQNLWRLQSVNALYPDIEDVEIDWAAKIDWVKPR